MATLISEHGRPSYCHRHLRCSVGCGRDRRGSFAPWKGAPHVRNLPIITRWLGFRCLCCSKYPRSTEPRVYGICRENCERTRKFVSPHTAFRRFPKHASHPDARDMPSLFFSCLGNLCWVRTCKAST